MGTSLCYFIFFEIYQTQSSNVAEWGRQQHPESWSLDCWCWLLVISSIDRQWWIRRRWLLHARNMESIMAAHKIRMMHHSLLWRRASSRIHIPFRFQRILLCAVRASSFHPQISSVFQRHSKVINRKISEWRRTQYLI